MTIITHGIRTCVRFAYEVRFAYCVQYAFLAVRMYVVYTVRISLSQFIATELALSKDQHGLILLMKVVIFLFQMVVKVVGLMEIEEVVEIVKVVGLMEREEVVEIVKVVEAVEAVGEVAIYHLKWTLFLTMAYNSALMVVETVFSSSMYLHLS